MSLGAFSSGESSNLRLNSHAKIQANMRTGAGRFCAFNFENKNKYKKVSTERNFKNISVVEVEEYL